MPPALPKIVFVDSTEPAILERLRAYTPAGFEFVDAGPDPADRRRLAKDADYLLVWAGPLPANLLAGAERVRLIQKVGQGVDKIDLEGARRRGIPVCNAGATNTTSVAEHTILLMLAVYKRLTAMYLDLRDGRWPKWEYRPVSHEISGKRVGIVGFGNIGRKVAQRLQGWECELAYYDPIEVPADVQRALGARPLPLDELLAWSDLVTLHVFLSAESRHLIGARELNLMKSSAILVNAARGEVVDEAALVAALRAGQLAGAGLDVLAQEPTDPRNPLLTMDNVVVSAHVAGATWEALERTIGWAMENCARVERGERPLSIQNGV